jgi:hypothetical protein
MAANTTDSSGRLDTQMPGSPPPRRLGAFAAVRASFGFGGFVLGLVLIWNLIWRFIGFTVDMGLYPRDGWQHNAIGWLGAVATFLTFLLCFMVPVAITLGAVCIGSDRLSERDLRDWAGAAWIITGIMLALDVFALAAIKHLAHSM